jgi:putative chitinase
MDPPTGGEMAASPNLAIRVTVGQIDRAVFFDGVRRTHVAGRPLKQKSVDSLNAILDEWQHRFPNGLDLRWIAYTMATGRHEAWDPRRQEISYDIGEIGGASKGYGKSGYFGRGLVQITHEDNYRQVGKFFGVDLVKQPWLACRKDISAGALILGSFYGWFRGDRLGRHKLSRYFNEHSGDAHGARNIINGDVAKNGPLVAAYYGIFLRLLAASLRAHESPAPEPKPPVEPTPVPTPEPQPIPSPLPDSKDPINTKRYQGLLIAAIGVIGSMIVRKLFPGQEGEWQSFLINYGPEITAGFGVVWSWIGHRQANAPITGTPLAAEIKAAKERIGEIQAACERMERAHEEFARAHVAQEPDDRPYAEPAAQEADEPEEKEADLATLVAGLPFEKVMREAPGVAPYITAALHARKMTQEAQRAAAPNAEPVIDVGAAGEGRHAARD